MSTDVFWTPQQYHQVPFIGDTVAKIGRIQAMLANPCDASAELWVFGFFQALPSLIITLAKPEWVDINITHKHRKPIKGRVLKSYLSKIIGGNILDIPVPRWAIFQLGEFAQRVGWYFMVGDATTDFVINWMSMVYQWNGCTGGGGGVYAYFSTTPTTFGINCNGAWNNYSIHTMGGHSFAGPGLPTGAIQTQAPCVPTLSSSLSVFPSPGFPAAQLDATRIVHVETGDVLATGDVSTNPDTPGTIGTIVYPFREYPSNSNFLLQFKGSGGLMGVSEESFKLNGRFKTTNPAFGPDP